MRRFGAVFLATTFAWVLALPYPSCAQPKRVVTIASGPVDGVYYPIAGALARIASDNLPQFHAAHPAAHLTPQQTALVGISLPLHPGAERFFREKGIARQRYLPAPYSRAVDGQPSWALRQRDPIDRDESWSPAPEISRAPQPVHRCE